MAADISSISTLFSNLDTTKSANSDTENANFGVNLSDYASIKSGAYYKMMKTYYEMKSSSSSTSSSTSKDSSDLIARMKDNSDTLKESADALLANKDSVFTKKNITDADGKTTYGYDTGAIYKEVNNFVNAYNSVLDQTQNSNATNILTTASSTVGTTKANEKLLNSIGITIGSDNHLSIDETTFKKADMTTASSLFQSTGSYGYEVSAQASMIYYYADLEASKSNTYTGNGTYTYNYATGELYNTTT